MRTTLAVAALVLGLAAPAIAQDSKPVTPPVAPAAKPADTTKAQPAVTKDAAKTVTKAADVKSGDYMIDFGCGDGKFLNRLQDRGWDTYGIEPSADVAFLRHRRLKSPPQEGSIDLN